VLIASLLERARPRVVLFADDPDTFVTRAIAAGPAGTDEITDLQAPWGIHRQADSAIRTPTLGLSAASRLAADHRITIISLDSAPCLPLRVVLVDGRDEGKAGGLHNIRGRRADRNPAARQLHIELDLADRLAARAD